MNSDDRYTDFTLGVTVWSLEVIESAPCEELQTICRLIGADILRQSPVELHGKTDRIVRFSQSDQLGYLQIDLRIDPTDQMEMVGLSVRCRTTIADDVEAELKRILTRSEVATALLRGKLGLTPPAT